MGFGQIAVRLRRKVLLLFCAKLIETRKIKRFSRLSKLDADGRVDPWIMHCIHIHLLSSLENIYTNIILCNLSIDQLAKVTLQVDVHMPTYAVCTIHA